MTAAGCRAIAVDLVGLGRSDKPTEMSDYTVARHVEWIRSALIDVLDLTNITFVLQDWGGIIGLRILGQHEDRVARVCLSNSGMFLRDPAKPVTAQELEPSGPFAAFQKVVRDTPNWEHWNVVKMMTLCSRSTTKHWSHGCGRSTDRGDDARTLPRQSWG